MASNHLKPRESKQDEQSSLHRDNPILTVRNDRLHLGWVFLRSPIFYETAPDVQRFCYEFVNMKQLIVHIRKFESIHESMAPFINALTRSLKLESDEKERKRQIARSWKKIRQIEVLEFKHQSGVKLYENQMKKLSLKDYYEAKFQALKNGYFRDGDMIGEADLEELQYYTRMMTAKGVVANAFQGIHYFLKTLQNPMENVLLECGCDYQFVMGREDNDADKSIESHVWKRSVDLKQTIDALNKMSMENIPRVTVKVNHETLLSFLNVT